MLIYRVLLLSSSLLTLGATKIPNAEDRVQDTINQLLTKLVPHLTVEQQAKSFELVSQQIENALGDREFQVLLQGLNAAKESGNKKKFQRMLDKVFDYVTANTPSTSGNVLELTPRQAVAAEKTITKLLKPGKVLTIKLRNDPQPVIDAAEFAAEEGIEANPLHSIRSNPPPLSPEFLNAPHHVQENHHLPKGIGKSWTIPSKNDGDAPVSATEFADEFGIPQNPRHRIQPDSFNPTYVSTYNADDMASAYDVSHEQFVEMQFLHDPKEETIRFEGHQLVIVENPNSSDLIFGVDMSKITNDVLDRFRNAQTRSVQQARQQATQVSSPSTSGDALAAPVPLTFSQYVLFHPLFDRIGLAVATVLGLTGIVGTIVFLVSFL